MGGVTYDCVILGATGFTGQLAAQYMVKAYGPRSATPVRWAIAGRSKPKLQGVLDSLQLDSHDAQVDMLTVDVSDREALERVIKSTAVIANFAGTPFIDKALPVVELCSQHGTHYVDITGELPMHRASYDRYDKACKASGSIVLHGCGFDSVPSDIGAFLAAKAMRQKHDCACSLIKAFYGDSSGGFSGGTLATVLYLLCERWRAASAPTRCHPSHTPCPPALPVCSFWRRGAWRQGGEGARCVCARPNRRHGRARQGQPRRGPHRLRSTGEEVGRPLLHGESTVAHAPQLRATLPMAGCVLQAAG